MGNPEPNKPKQYIRTNHPDGQANNYLLDQLMQFAKAERAEEPIVLKDFIQVYIKYLITYKITNPCIGLNDIHLLLDDPQFERHIFLLEMFLIWQLSPQDVPDTIAIPRPNGSVFDEILKPNFDNSKRISENKEDING